MPRKKIQCPTCDGVMAAASSQCRKCKPTYVRTKAHREKMAAALAGVPKRSLKGKKRPAHSLAMKKWWTAERRKKRSQDQLDRNPNARYHGLSSRQAAALVRSVGHCQRCDHDGSKSRLGVHHRNRDKHDQRPENLEILCHSCHMKEHRHEIGWAAYWKKRT